MTVKRIDFLGFPLDVGVTAEMVCELIGQKKGPRLVTFINPAAWALARKRPEYLAALRQMSLCLSDGEGIASLCRWFVGEDCRRISFDPSSLAMPFFKTAADSKSSLMLIGGKPGVDEGVQAKLHLYYPELRIVGTQHGFGEVESKISDIIAKSPDIVVVGMESPRQEAFLLALRDAGYRGMAITCGDFFEQYLESDPYYPAWINKWNLRFAYRLYKEPGRLWRRYLIDYPFFVVYAVQTLLNRFGTTHLKSQ